MTRSLFRRIGASVIVAALIGSVTTAAIAAPVSTAAAISAEQVDTQRAALMEVLQRQAVRDALAAQGVNPAEVEQRVARLTADEVQLLGNQLDQLPAAGDAGGVIVTVLLVFLVTDILCVTDIYPFVNCISKS